MDNQKLNFQFYFSPSQHSSTLYVEIGRARSDSFSQSPSHIGNILHTPFSKFMICVNPGPNSRLRDVSEQHTKEMLDIQ